MNYRETAELVLNRLKNSAGDGRWDDHLSLAMTSPFSDTSPALIAVPPRSIPA